MCTVIPVKIFSCDVVSRYKKQKKWKKEQTCKSVVTVIERGNDNYVYCVENRRNIFSYELPLSAFI